MGSYFWAASKTDVTGTVYNEGIYEQLEPKWIAQGKMFYENCHS